MMIILFLVRTHNACVLYMMICKQGAGNDESNRSSSGAAAAAGSITARGGGQDNAALTQEYEQMGHEVSR